jgi:hypothetical protein
MTVGACVCEGCKKAVRKITKDPKTQRWLCEDCLAQARKHPPHTQRA